MHRITILSAFIGAFGVGLLYARTRAPREDTAKYDALSKQLYADVEGAVDALKSKDEKERRAAYDALLVTHEELLFQLRRLAGEKPEDRGPVAKMDPAIREKLDRWRRRDSLGSSDTIGSYNTRELAVELLGRFNDPKALPLLVENVEFHDEGLIGDGANPLGRFPCARALHVIGKPCVPAILAFLSDRPTKDVSDFAIDRFARVLLEVYCGPADEWREGIAAVERAIAHAKRSDPANLKRLLDKLKVLTKGRDQKDE